MKRSIFYSWQSDLEGAGNRNLIEDALKRALKSIRRDESETVEPVLDRDTAGLSGAPSISESIFAKISLADVFVADVSIINKGSTRRLIPNPNVLIELGYAIAQLGWERVLLVQNTAYGDPEDLPFDLRGRRIVPYSFERDTNDRSEVRALLQGRLEAALKSALSNSTQTSLPTGFNAPFYGGASGTQKIMDFHMVAHYLFVTWAQQDFSLICLYLMAPIVAHLLLMQK
ncbi:MAG: nucleotide-binding protein [Methylobacter sp.]|jgi:hypothetical protein|nr:nucleotide-binding protein [Methylobacter sp.]